MKPYFKLLFSGISAAILLAACNPGSDKATGAYATPAIPQDKEIEANVEKLLNKMTLDEKVGQMVQITVDRVMRGTQVDEERLQEVIGTYKVGSLLNVIGGRAQTAA